LNFTPLIVHLSKKKMWEPDGETGLALKPEATPGMKWISTGHFMKKNSGVTCFLLDAQLVVFWRFPTCRRRHGVDATVSGMRGAAQQKGVV
jgi:hypothetical protein